MKTNNWRDLIIGFGQLHPYVSWLHSSCSTFLSFKLRV